MISGPPEPGGPGGPLAPPKFLEINTKVGTGPPKVLKVHKVVPPPKKKDFKLPGINICLYPRINMGNSYPRINMRE